MQLYKEILCFQIMILFKGETVITRNEFTGSIFKLT
jgi:hypothetical protein